jgi:hypothetical protein
MVSESKPRLDTTISYLASPIIHCSQFRMQHYLEQSGLSLLSAALAPYPTLPEALPKDGYVSSSDSGSESANTYDGAPAEKNIHWGQHHFHKAYTGPEPVDYVDTGLHEGGQHDGYEAYSEGDVSWER